MTRLLAALAIALLFGGAPASAQTYPSKPITMIVPFAAGGATDVLARFLGERMRAILGQTDHRRERHRRRRQHRRRACGARARRRLHPGDGHLDHQHAAGRALSVAVRSDQRSRADHADRERAAADRRQEESAGEQSQGADRLAQGQSGQGFDRHSGGRRHRPSRRSVVPQRDRRQGPVHSVPRQRPGAAGPGGRPDRSADRAGVEFLSRRPRRERSSPMPSRRRLAARRQATSRPPPRPGMPGFQASLWYGLWAPKDTPKDIVAQIERGDARGAGARGDAQALRRSRHCKRRRASSRRRRPCARSRRRKPTNGGRSSRPPTSRDSDAGRGQQ